MVRRRSTVRFRKGALVHLCEVAHVPVNYGIPFGRSTFLVKRGMWFRCSSIEMECSGPRTLATYVVRRMPTVLAIPVTPRSRVSVSSSLAASSARSTTTGLADSALSSATVPEWLGSSAGLRARSSAAE